MKLLSWIFLGFWFFLLLFWSGAGKYRSIFDPWRLSWMHSRFWEIVNEGQGFSKRFRGLIDRVLMAASRHLLSFHWSIKRDGATTAIGQTTTRYKLRSICPNQSAEQTRHKRRPKKNKHHIYIYINIYIYIIIIIIIIIIVIKENPKER